MIKLLESLALSISSGILGIAIKHFIDNPFREIAFGIPWLRVKSGSLSAYWMAEYQFVEKGKKKSVVALYELIEWAGSVVLIREIPMDGRPAITVMKARKRNGYLTGTYENATDYDTLHGVFQVWIHPRGKEFYGRFLGFSSQAPNEFNTGEWSWSRLTADRKAGALDMAKAEFTEHQRSLLRI